MRRILAIVLSLVFVAACAPASAEQDFAIVGEWMWSSTIYDAGEGGAEKLFSRAAEMGVTDVYLLIKGTLGTVSFNKTDNALVKAHEDRDLLQEAIDAAHARGIRLHAWFTSSNDSAYKAAYPDSGLWHYVRGRDNDIVHLADEGFIAYMESVITDLCSNYDIDGLHLDYIRYNHLCNGWSADDLAKLAERGANVDKLKEMIDKTFYAESPDADYIFAALRNGDADARILADYRRDNVVAFAEKMVAAARAAKPELIITAAMMPDGAASEDTSFADLHYGQRYEDAAKLYDYILPMAYSKDYGQDAAWVANVAKNAIASGNKVVCGLQAYYPATSGVLMDDVNAVKALISADSDALLGIANFRSTTFQYVKLTSDPEQKTLDVKVINTLPATALLKIEVCLADGLKATGAELISGFASAEAVISEDGAVVAFEAADLLAGDAEGVLKVTFEGDAQDKTPALVRVYAENETRAYQIAQ